MHIGTQEEAAEAYDIAAIKFRGLNAVTNFDMSRYDVNSILESANLPVSGAAKRLKDVEQAEIMAMDRQLVPVPAHDSDLANGITHYPTIAFQQPQMHPNFTMHYPSYYSQQKIWCKQEQDQSPSDISFHDLNSQLHLGSNTHNFLNHPSPYNNSLMSLDSSSPIEQSSTSGSINLYGSGTQGDHFQGYGIPPAVGGTVIGSNEGGNGFGDSEVNLYYLSQQSSAGSTCNSGWVPTGIPTVATPRNGAMAVCHAAAPTFTVWNDT